MENINSFKFHLLNFDYCINYIFQAEINFVMTIYHFTTIIHNLQIYFE